MKISLLNTHKALNKAYLKVKPNRIQIETFKKNIINLFDKINESESEEFHKNLISEFLKNTYYDPGYYINTKGRADLVIHSGKDALTPVGVLFETKKPGNKSEMPAPDNLKSKAFYEIILYYLRERIREKNISIKYLVITDIYEWFIFSSTDFERLFAGNKKLISQFIDFDEGRLAGTITDFFYKNIAEPIIDEIDSDISVTHFDIRDYESIIRNPIKSDDNKLVALYKIFSPEHFLRLPFANDSNSLDKVFYSELLHIIGLEETKEGSKKVIGRKKENKRDPGSLIENAISILISEDCLSHLSKRSDYGTTLDEQLFNVALELSITWINRILFLKLLESQLVKYNKDDKTFMFLNKGKISDFDELNKLFFRILAVKEQERSVEIKEKYANIPYLNSSLFEPSDLEHRTIRINSLNDNTKLPLLSNTILKDKTGKKLKGEIEPLEYLFSFLDAYDFSNEGSLDIQEENKTLINASVLGLIFEKINGYKDGSFFTPGFITMYMCHETITRAVVQKFNDVKGWQCESINDVYNKITDIDESNRIINSLRICDPAVGSGHFLVSALNEIIAIKSELGILADKEGKRLKDYHVEVINDELIITDENGNFFEYNHRNKESQRVQETLFREKQMIIENCLFGVDVNPNSVKICRLRLWIELLKNAYYKGGSGLRAQISEQSHELETLPNIDINIKCGNSLISRYPLDADIKSALKSSRWTVDNYKEAVMTYRNAQSKDEKRSMEELIRKIKSEFETEVSKKDKRFLKLNKLKGDLVDLTGHGRLFDMTKTEKDEWNRKVNRITSEIQAIESEIEEIKNNKIYENAFEWRFEFPEVLNNDGDFTGFDIVIGNPPYIRQEEIREFKPYFKENFKTFTGTTDLYVFFVEKGHNVLTQKGTFCYIMPNKWMQSEYGRHLRSFLFKYQLHSIIDFGDIQVFPEATTYPCIISSSKNKVEGKLQSLKITSSSFDKDLNSLMKSRSKEIDITKLNDGTWILRDKDDLDLIHKLKTTCVSIDNYVSGKAFRGILTGLTEAFIVDEVTKNKLIDKDEKSNELLKPFLLGRNIKRYSPINASSWLILIPKGFTIKQGFDSSNLNYITETLTGYRNMTYDTAWDWFESNYSGIANHLLKYRDKANVRIDKGDFWWELRSCDYYQEFINPKIMYQKFQVKPCFIYDELGYYCNDSMWIISSSNKTLLAILNSSMGWWLISKYCTAIQNGFQLIWKYFGQIPIPNLNGRVVEIINKQVDQVIQIRREDPDSNTSSLESEIDRLVYELYGLTEEEILIVEGG